MGERFVINSNLSSNIQLLGTDMLHAVLCILFLFYLLFVCLFVCLLGLLVVVVVVVLSVSVSSPGYRGIPLCFNLYK